MLIETSKDLLFVVIAFCILWVTIFICWILYYLIMTTKRVHDTVKATKEKVDKVGEILELAKNKIESGASYVGAVVEAIVKLTDYFKKKKGKKTETNGEKKKTKILVKGEK